ncbi:MAG: DUF3035 domain-containing protein [Rhodospirillaceae bacterium]|nr:DUF3035 domain-containing protein [Rhodospirillaceae bacterium]
MRGRAYLGLMAATALAVALGGCQGIRESLGVGKHPPDEFQVVSRAPLSMPPDFNLRPPQPGAPRPQEGTPRDQAESALFGSGEASADAAGQDPVVTPAPAGPVESAATIDSIPSLASVAGPPAQVQGGDTISSFAGRPLGASAASASAPAATAAPGRSAPLSSGEAALLAHSGATDVDPSIRQTVDRETKELQESDTRFIDRLIFWQKRPEPGVVIDPGKEQQRLQENAALGKPLTEGETPVIERRRRAWLEGIF